QVLARSSDAGAAWMVRAGVIPEDALVRAGWRVARTVFIAPVLGALTVGYLWVGTPLSSIVAHILTLGLLAEAVLRMVSRAQSVLPFSLPLDERELAKALIAFAMLGYALLGLIAAAIVHAVYATWPGIIAFDAWLGWRVYDSSRDPCRPI